MVDPDDNIKLIDFGIAGDSARTRRLTYANFTANPGHRGLHLHGASEGQARRRAAPTFTPWASFFTRCLLARLPFSGSLADGDNERPASELSDASPHRRSLDFAAAAGGSVPRARTGSQNRYAKAREFAHDLQHLEEVGVEDRIELRDWNERKSIPSGRYFTTVLSP